MQTINFSGYYDKICCPFCKKLILPNSDEEWDVDNNICKHILYIYDNDSNLHYLSNEVKKQLSDKGYNIEIIEDLITQEHEEFYLNSVIDYPNAFEFEFDSGVPNGVYLYIAFSPFLNEKIS
jgi:hypothetical protein